MGQHYLYRHIRPDLNVPFYIGIGTKNQKRPAQSHSITEYFRAFEYKARRSAPWRGVFNKNNGIIEVDIITESDDYSFIKEKEIEFIKLYGRRDLNLGTLLNFTDGGQGMLGNVPTNETRRKKSIIAKGKNLSEEAKLKISQKNTGKRRSDEVKMKMSIQRKKNPKYLAMAKKMSANNKGRNHSEDTREKIRVARTGKFWTEETRKRVGENRRAKNLKWSDETRLKNCLKIEQYDTSGNLLNTFIGREEAGKSIGVSASCIQNGLNRSKSYKGFLWIAR